MTDLVPDTDMNQLVSVMGTDETAALQRLDTLAGDYPRDARLPFLKGSMLVGQGRTIEGHNALSQAVQMAPEFAIARFQLGFLELTSGEPDRAMQSWQPLKGQLPDGHYLRLFVEGLEALARDDFDTIETQLLAGIAANTENEPLNDDMRLILSKIEPLKVRTPQADTEVSATSFLLGQTTRH